MIGKAVFPGGNAQSLDNIAGQPIAEYIHTKSGTVHKLEGPAKAKNIVFKATGDYSDGDTWTLNNTPVTVTYNGGEELLPTAVLIGDVVQAVVMGNQVRLMLQKPTLQPSMLDNGYFKINQRNKTEYVGSSYTVDRWFCEAGKSVTINDGYITASHIWQPIEKSEPIIGNTFTLAIKLFDGKTYAHSGRVELALNSYILFEANGTQIYIWSNGNMNDGSFSFQINNGPVNVVAVKMEPGNRFTGWPVWDYGAELLKCQRYLLGIRPGNYKGDIIPIGQGVATTNGKVRILIPTPVAMRTKPVFNVNINNLRVVSTTPAVADGIIPQTVADMFYSNSLIFIDIYAQGLTAGNAYELYLYGTTTETMLFSAEL